MILGIGTIYYFIIKKIFVNFNIAIANENSDFDNANIATHQMQDQNSVYFKN